MMNYPYISRIGFNWDSVSPALVMREPREKSYSWNDYTCYDCHVTMRIDKKHLKVFCPYCGKVLYHHEQPMRVERVSVFELLLGKGPAADVLNDLNATRMLEPNELQAEISEFVRTQMENQWFEYLYG